MFFLITEARINCCCGWGLNQSLPSIADICIQVCLIHLLPTTGLTVYKEKRENIQVFTLLRSPDQSQWESRGKWTS